MRIGVDIRCLMEKYYSGVSEYTYSILDNLFKLDNKNSYILFYNTAKNLTVPKFSYPNVSYKKFHYPNKLLNLSFLLFHTPKIDRMIGTCDIFFMPSNLFHAWSPACKKIVTVHDISYEFEKRYFSPRSRLWLKLVNTKRLFKEADALISVSDTTKRDVISEYGIVPEKIYTIHLGVSPDYFPRPEQDSDTILKKYNLPKKFFLFLGNIEPRKNIYNLIEAFTDFKKKNNSDFHLVFAGKMRFGYKLLQKKVKDSAFKDFIHFLGYVDSSDKPFLYNSCYAFVYPSWYEGFGLPPLEAMSCGKPVIVSNASSLPEIVQDAGILVDPKNPLDISGAMSNLVLDRDLYHYFSGKGLARSKNFQWQKAALLTLDLFSKTT